MGWSSRIQEGLPDSTGRRLPAAPASRGLSQSMQWTEFIGGDVVLTMTHKWQKRFNASDVEVVERMDQPVEPKIVNELLRRFDEFRKAYEEDGLSVEEFDDYGATRRTLRQFLGGTQDLTRMLRDFMVPNPDV